jgi:CheY-like chemotaxis protein
MNPSVLIADDEKDLVEAFTLLLEDLGYTVYSALDGETTLALLREKKPDVLILDINMPRVSGEDVLRALAALPLKIKVIVSTGHTIHDQQLKDRILRVYKVSAFLEKPTAIEEIDYVIKQVLKEA